MQPAGHHTTKPRILYSCYHSRSREGEHFIPEYILGFQVSGTLTINDGRKEYVFKEGDIRFCHRNRLAKFIKEPPPGGEFRSVSVYLDQQTLRHFSMEYGYKAEHSKEGDTIMNIRSSPLYTSYLQSLMPYLDAPEEENEALLSLKIKEAILLLLKTNPGLKDILFNFSEPGKIDLEAFMHKNFHFNVALPRFAYLTGRSLATFKRDFEKIFHTSPSRWLQQKRLQEAYYLIREKHKKPSDVYLEVGFEDLSHFSFAFKKTFGVAPSLVGHASSY